MVTKCVVPDCGNSCNTKLSVTLFSFPKDPQLAQQWLVATRARGVKQIKSHHKVCSKHFEKHLILDNFGATRLEPGSVPTIFEWNRKPSVKTEVSPLVSRTNPFLTVESVIELPLNSYRRVILPKPAPGQVNPKVKIPPLAKRVAGLSPDSKQRLDCDVIHPESITGGQKWSQSRMSPGRERACLQVSDDDSNGPVHVGHHIEEYDSSDCPLIEVDPLQGEIEDPLESESSVLLTHSESMAGEVIIEECSIIEDEIMQPHQTQEPITAMAEKPSSNTDHDNNDVPVNEEESLPIETAELYQDEVPLSRNPILPKKTLPTSRKSSDESTCNRSLNNLPKNVVLLQFDARTGLCTENPDLNDLSAQDIASIKKSLDSSQSSRVVILKKGGVGKTAERISSSAEPPVKRASKVQPILPKGGCSNLQQNPTASSNQPPSVSALPKNNVLTKLNASGSQAYFIPQGSNITSSLASTLLLQNSSGHKHTNQVIPTTSSVPAQTNVANFLIATPTTSTLVSSQSTPSRAAPVVYQLGNVVPVGSALPRKPPEKPPQNNNVNIVAPQMTYLIPIGGSIPRPVLPKIASCSDADDPVLPSSRESVSEAEQRLLKQVELLKSALRRKSSTILELRKDKNRLTRKLKLLGAAMGKFRKASMLNLSTSRCLKGVDDQEVANMTLDLKDFGSRRNLRDVVNTILHLSRILNDQVKSHIPETPNGRLDTLSGSGEVNVEMEPPS